MTELTTEAVDLPLADTSDMVEMHRVFRNALFQAPDLIGSVAPGDSERRALVGAYYANVLRLLHAHHDGEDLLLTPKLVERNPEHVEQINAVAAQHSQVQPLIEATEAGLAAWQPNPGSTAALLASAGELQAALTAHLDGEEQQILPLASGCINVREWGELPAHGLGNFDGDRLWLVLGLIRAELSTANQADMDAHLPPPVAAMWAVTGQAEFQAFVAQLQQ